MLLRTPEEREAAYSNLWRGQCLQSWTSAALCWTAGNLQQVRVTDRKRFSHRIRRDERKDGAMIRLNVKKGGGPFKGSMETPINSLSLGSVSRSGLRRLNVGDVSAIKHFCAGTRANVCLLDLLPKTSGFNSHEMWLCRNSSVDAGCCSIIRND